MKKTFSSVNSNSGITLAGLYFKNRVGLAAGFDKNADFFEEFSVFGFSFIEIGTVTPLPQAGNPKPRLFRLKKDRALVNRMGFNNKGINHAVKNLKGREHSLLLGGNIGKNTLTPNNMAVNDYLRCFRELYDVVDYLVINVSCPNITDLEKLQDNESLCEIIGSLMKERACRNTKKPVFLKISPDLTQKQVDETLELVNNAGIDGLIVTNTTRQRNNLATNQDLIKSIGLGGLSGAPLKKRSLELVSYICKQQKFHIPVIASGGIMVPQDAIDMIEAGASLVQVYTGFIYEGPFLVKEINKALESYFKKN